MDTECSYVHTETRTRNPVLDFSNPKTRVWKNGPGFGNPNYSCIASDLAAGIGCLQLHFYTQFHRKHICFSVVWRCILFICLPLVWLTDELSRIVVLVCYHSHKMLRYDNCFCEFLIIFIPAKLLLDVHCYSVAFYSIGNAKWVGVYSVLIVSCWFWYYMHVLLMDTACEVNLLLLNTAWRWLHWMLTDWCI